MSHSRLKPTLAPTTVVAISSPLPTIELARIIPGPKAATVFQNVLGGGEYLLRLSLTCEFSMSVTPAPFPRYLAPNNLRRRPCVIPKLSMAYASWLKHNVDHCDQIPTGTIGNPKKLLRNTISTMNDIFLCAMPQ